MKKIVLILLTTTLVFALSSCGSSKEVSKSPIKTFVQPGADLVSGNGLIRGWGMGKSDSETSAHKKAQINASAALAATLSKTLESTTQEYVSTVSESNIGLSKSLLNDYVKTTVNQVLNGATIIYDQWAKKTENGQYVNYIVMELKGEAFLQELYKEVEKNNTKVDKDLLQEIFMKHINEAGKSKK